MLCDHHHDWFPERFHHPTQKLCSHERIRPHFPLPRPSVISLLLPFSLFDHSRSLIEMGHTLFVLLCLACFTEHYIFKVHPCQSIPGCCKSGLCNWILAPCSCRTLKLKQWSCLTRPCPTELSVTSPLWSIIREGADAGLQPWSDSKPGSLHLTILLSAILLSIFYRFSSLGALESDRCGYGFSLELCHLLARLQINAWKALSTVLTRTR